MVHICSIAATHSHCEGPQETRRSLTAQDPRHRLPRVSTGKREQQIVDATPALELAVLTRCEYAKPRKPAVPAPNTKCATTARDMNRAMRVVEKRNFSLMHLVTGALGKQPEQQQWINQQQRQRNAPAAASPQTSSSIETSSTRHTTRRGTAKWFETIACRSAAKNTQTMSRCAVKADRITSAHSMSGLWDVGLHQTKGSTEQKTTSME